MKEKIKQEKGVTLLILVITVMVLLILTFTIVINTKTNASTKRLTQLKSDIQNLEQKVSDFYNEYGEIPAEIEYTNIDQIKDLLNEKEKSSESKFYVIDLQAMKGISLNYGRDYEEIKNTNTDNANKYEDVYIINNITHNIFYIRGVDVTKNGVYEKYYTKTNTVQEVPDVDLSIKYDNIDTSKTNPIAATPEDIEIIEADANKGIVIKDKNENEWVWVEVPKDTAFSGLNIDTSKELTTQNYNDIKNKMITYAGVYRKGSATQNCNWTDEWYDRYGGSYDATGYNTIGIADADQFTEAQKYYEKIYTDKGTTEATNYTSGTTYYAKIKLDDTMGCGITYDDYNILYKKMLKSVYAYGGFWIGRYEAGIEGSITDVSKARTQTSERISVGVSPNAISQKDAIPYNYVYCSEAQALAKEMTPNNSYTSSLMFGIQWDLVCKYLEVKGKLAIADINSNSTSWGNYENAKIENITSGKYAIKYANTWELGTWTQISGTYTKPNTSPDYDTLLSTGISDYTKEMNIYDFAGNEWEWTLEKTSDSIYHCANRGGGCYVTGSNYPASYRILSYTTYSDGYLGFRPTLYAN